MKQKITLLTLFYFFFINLIFSQWTNVGSAGFGLDEAFNQSLAIAPDGTPYMAYADYTGADRLSVMKYSGSTWEVVGTYEFTPSNATEVSLAIDSNNVPYVAYKSGSHQISVYKFNGSSWELVGAEFFETLQASHISLAIDSNNVPYISYRDTSLPVYHLLSVMKFNGTSWEFVGSAQFSAGAISQTSLVFDSSDTPYVAFRDEANSNKITVMKYTSFTWDLVGSAGFSSGSVASNSRSLKLNIDANDIPYIAYSDASNSDIATVMTFNGTTWVNVGTGTISAGGSSYLDMVIDSGNNIYIAYRDANNGNKATVKGFDGATWSDIGVAGFSTGNANYVTMDIDNNNIIYVGYRDVPNGNGNTVRKYNGSLLSINNDSFATLEYYPNPTQDFVVIHSKSNIDTIIVYNMLGQSVIEQKGNLKTTNIDMSHLQAGNYFMHLFSGSEDKVISVIKKY